MNLKITLNYIAKTMPKNTLTALVSALWIPGNCFSSGYRVFYFQRIKTKLL